MMADHEPCWHIIGGDGKRIESVRRCCHCGATQDIQREFVVPDGHGPWVSAMPTGRLRWEHNVLKTLANNARHDDEILESDGIS